jgi:hypothetical protein
MTRALFIQQKKKAPLLQWATASLALLMLAAVFASYYAPDMMFAMTSQLMTMCGFQ